MGDEIHRASSSRCSVRGHPRKAQDYVHHEPDGPRASGIHERLEPEYVRRDNHHRGKRSSDQRDTDFARECFDEQQ